MNEAKRKIVQAYNQSPWRRQLRVIGVVLAIFLFYAIVKVINLNIATQIGEVGRQIQKLQLAIEDYEIQNAHLENELAYLTSYPVMKKRAEELGFRPVRRDEVIYVVVPEYSGRLPAENIQPEQGESIPSNEVILSPSFHETLVDWFADAINLPMASIMGGKHEK